MIELPTFQENSADFSYDIEIENKIISFRFVYNIRNQFWFLNIESGNNEIKGLKIVEGFPLLFTHKAKFPDLEGDFLLMARVENEEFTYDNFGVAWSLYYLNKEELEEWLSENGL
jgi:hypothetical protein